MRCVAHKPESHPSSAPSGHLLPQGEKGTSCPVPTAQLSALARNLRTIPTPAQFFDPPNPPAFQPPVQSSPVPSPGKGARPCELVAAGAVGAGVRRIRRRGAVSSCLGEIGRQDHAQVTHGVQGIGHAGGRPSRRRLCRQGVKSVAGSVLCRAEVEPTAPGKPPARGVRSSSKR